MVLQEATGRRGLSRSLQIASAAATIESSDETVLVTQEKAFGATETTPYNFDGVECGDQETSEY